MYNNAIPDFRPVSEAVVPIPNMSENRFGKTGNFKQANEALAKFLNANPDCELYSKIKRKGQITPQDVNRYRKKNKLTWHEESDLVHMDLVASKVNSIFGHLGGISEAKQKKQGKKYQTQRKQKNSGNCKKEN